VRRIAVSFGDLQRAKLLDIAGLSTVKLEYTLTH